CTGGVAVCNPNNSPTAETCDGIDNDCDGAVDENNAGGGAACNTGLSGVCASGTMLCADGALECIATGGTPELCDGIDNDCDGVVDNGNPGGGAPCGATIGGCGEYTLCVNGSYVCRGTFVAPPGIGAPGNPGTQAQPVSTIMEGQELAKALNNGADICICATTAGTPTIYPEYVTMSEGNSIFGGYKCADWSRDIANYETRIEPDEFDPYPTPSLPNPCNSVAVYFPPSAAPATALDGLSVYGRRQFGRYDNDSVAIQVINASAVLQDVIAKGGRADYSRALEAGADSANSHHITVTRGRYVADGGNGTVFSGQRAVSLGMTGTFMDVVMVGLGARTGSTIGFACWDCGATTITGGSINGGSGNTATGMYVTGDVNGFTMTNTSITATMPGYNPYSTGAWFNDCIGAPSLTNVTIDAGYFHWQGSGVTSRGAQCAPTIIGAEINGNGGIASTGTAVECTDDSVCNVIDSVITSGNIGVSCRNGGCGTFSGNTITTMAGDSPLNNNIRIDNAHPNFHANEIVAGSCWGGAGSYRLVLAEITNSTAVLTNNVFRDQPCPNTTVDMVKLGAGAAVTIHNNTFQMETCTNCAAKRALVLVVPSGGANVRNNIFVNAGTADFAKGFGV
ncbi:MAG TPA: putative metal-binding motif-containing protein, partial [Polyangium sp.]|nr:putative metal-binding motif-containing protein [Polyangium sp.]